MINPEYIGHAAGILTAVALMPQVLKSWQTKSTKDISIPWIIANTLGIILWLVYGFMIVSRPIIIFTSFELVVALSLLFLKVRYR